MTARTADRVTGKSSDMGALMGHLAAFVGQPLLFFRFSYQEELTAHFGQALPYRHPKMANLKRGSYVLRTRASHWLASDAIGRSWASGDRASLPELPAGVRVNSVTPLAVVPALSAVLPSFSEFRVGLYLQFEDGAQFYVQPAFEEQPDDVPSEPTEESDVADWELFTPDGYLRVGPGPNWSWEPKTETE